MLVQYENLDVQNHSGPPIILATENNNNTIYQLNEKDLTNENGWFQSAKIQNNPNVLFIFGANTGHYIERTSGGSGQADPNAKGSNKNVLPINTMPYKEKETDNIKKYNEKIKKIAIEWCKKGGFVFFPMTKDGKNVNIGTGIARENGRYSSEGQKFANELKAVLETIKINHNHKNLSLKTQKELTNWYNTEMDNLEKEFKSKFISEVKPAVIFNQSYALTTEFDQSSPLTTEFDQSSPLTTEFDQSYALTTQNIQDKDTEIDRDKETIISECKKQNYTQDQIDDILNYIKEIDSLKTTLEKKYKIKNTDTRTIKEIETNQQNCYIYEIQQRSQGKYLVKYTNEADRKNPQLVINPGEITKIKNIYKTKLNHAEQKVREEKKFEELKKRKTLTKEDKDIFKTIEQQCEILAQKKEDVLKKTAEIKKILNQLEEKNITIQFDNKNVMIGRYYDHDAVYLIRPKKILGKGRPEEVEFDLRNLEQILNIAKAKTKEIHQKQETKKINTSKNHTQNALDKKEENKQNLKRKDMSVCKLYSLINFIKTKFQALWDYFFK